MSTPLLYERQRDWLRDLLSLIQKRSETETGLEETYQRNKEQAEKTVQAARQTLKLRRDRDLSAAETKFEQTQRAAHELFTLESTAADKELAELRMRLTHEFDDADDRAKSALQEAEWTATSFFEAGEKESFSEMLTHQQCAQNAGAKTKKLWDELEQLLGRCGLTCANVMAETPVKRATGGTAETGKVLESTLTSAEEFVGHVRQLFPPRLLTLPVGIGMFIVLTLLACVPALFMKPPLVWVLGGIFAGMVLFVVVRSLIKTVSVRQSLHEGDRAARALELVEALGARLKEQAEADHEKVVDALRIKHEQDMQAARRKHVPLIEDVAERRTLKELEVVDRHARTKDGVRTRRDETLTAAQEENWSTRAAAEARYEDELNKAETAFSDRMAELDQAYDKGWRELARLWHGTLARLREEFAALREENNRLFPVWESADWPDRPPVSEVPRGLRVGEIPFDLAHIPKGIPEDGRLKLEQPLLGQMPAFLPVPQRCAVLLKARDQGKTQAVQVLQALMLRFLTSLPPGKCRFTIVDPVGLGDNFASFMHLADYDELLVNSRIWTEPIQIDQRLTDLTAHMENVIQKYLRHQFKSIEEYNAAAGEVAEPYRVLVAANFPTNFTADAARRLVSIASSGSSCGVYTLVSVDTRAPLPHGFSLADLELPCLNLVWQNDKFSFKDEILSKFDLALDGPPDPVITSRLVHKIGAQAKDASRVEVPFDFVAPEPDKVWTGDSGEGISVPIGRAGATKRQSLQLGKGTSQHGLIAGKTGSGKSTLLHAIVTNLSLTYSPDEVELYLIDFKKGVEFKPYAEHHLPHARVVAIESEREFGLSVLQRLDAELRARGDKFRDVGVNDLQSFRAERPKEKLPRILLIVDEFQEFFVEDDKLAAEAALLLDRLVRQGRAFGLHVLLGSQTLGGAYSLARSTIDQMAVRIALQCSEADAHLILSKDNAAARLLSRPGEAIYNSANGLIEGNDLFQVVWLPDERRERILEQLDQRATAKQRESQLVFEGNAPAEVHKNALLDRQLRANKWPAAPRAFSAWVGDAVAIKDPTAAVFRPQSGSHLLLIGQHEEAALSILTTAIVSLAAQHRPGETGTPQVARFHILDGTPADDPNADYLARLADGFPHTVQSADVWGIAPLLAELAELVNSRHARTTEDRSNRYVVIQGLQRFRDLRRSDEDFGFRRGDKSATPAENFAAILRDGPTVGVHLLMWCDTLTNVNRHLDRTMLRECTQRILFQMSATDSSHLMDSPVAARLGRNRALFHREEQEQPEKFRPYGLPSQEWLNWAKEQLRKRAKVKTGA
jgi:hypothetical protein